MENVITFKGWLLTSNMKNTGWVTNWITQAEYEEKRGRELVVFSLPKGDAKNPIAPLLVEIQKLINQYELNNKKP